MLIGTGPFILSDHKPGEYWRLKWNPLYFKRLPEKTQETDSISPERNTLQLIVIVVVIAVGLMSFVLIKLKRAQARRKA